MFKEIFPNSNYYLLNVVGSPNFPSYYGVEKELNELMEKRAKINGIKIIHNSESVHEAHEKENCFDEDAVHLNPRGYEVMLKEILKNI